MPNYHHLQQVGHLKEEIQNAHTKMTQFQNQLTSLQRQETTGKQQLKV